jgi:uncharacterized protein (DUF2252 family)
MHAPFESDVKRLAASFVIAARWRGFRSSQAREVAVQVVASYRESTRKRARTGVLEAWYSEITIDDVLALGKNAELIGRAEYFKKRIADARRQTHEHVFQEITAPVRGSRGFVDQPPPLYHVDKSQVNENAIAATLKRYRETLAEERRKLFDRLRFIDMAIKVVGVGSVGTRCLVLLFVAAPDDTLFLRVKEARPSVLERYTGYAPVPHNG